MRISDWSSDVCSSDLRQVAGFWSGLSHGTGGIIGVIGVGALTSYLMRRDHRWELWIPAAGYSASAPAFAAAFLATDWKLCVVLLTRSEEHTSELQSLMRISYAVFCLKKKKKHNTEN